MLEDWKESEFYWKMDTKLGTLTPVSPVLNSSTPNKMKKMMLLKVR